MNLTQLFKNNSIPSLFSLFFSVENNTSAKESNKISNSFIISLLSRIFVFSEIILNKSFIISLSISIDSSLNLRRFEGSKIKAYLYLL